MRAIILAAGEGQRWDNYLGVPKHLIPIKGEPLIHRTQRLLHECGVTDVQVVCKPDDREAFVSEWGTWAQPAIILRDWVQEQEPSRYLWHPQEKTLILYGDCYFTEDIIYAMVTEDAMECWKVYARHDGSVHTGKPYGEMFGWVFWPWQQIDIDRARIAAIDVYERGEWNRCLGWEVHRIACGQDPWHHDWHDPHHFVEWDDETDDFDWPKDWDAWVAINKELA